MRLLLPPPPIMSNNYLLAPIQECASDDLLKDIKVAVLGAGRVGKSGKRRRGGPRLAKVPRGGKKKKETKTGGKSILSVVVALSFRRKK